MYHQQQQAPTYVCDQIQDPSTLNYQLPHGNDVFPPLELRGLLPQTEQVAGSIVSSFRKIIQDKIENSPLHKLHYNVMAFNRFYNDTFIAWCQKTVEFTDYLMAVQGEHPNQAIPKAVEKINASALANTFANNRWVERWFNPQQSQTIPQASVAAANELVAIEKAITAHRNNYSQQQGGYHPSSGQSYGPPVHGPSIGDHTAPPSPSYATTAPNTASAPANGSDLVSARYASSSVQSSREEWPNTGNSDHGTGGNEMTYNTMSTPPPQDVYDTPPPELDEGPAPSSIKELVMDPFAYLPHWANPIDEKRPFDVIYNRGGVEIRPAHLSEWTRTWTQRTPWTLAFSPFTHMLFHVKWPDGVVQEFVKELTVEMDYLRHELDDDLRRMATKSKGKVLVNTRNVHDYDREPKPIEEEIKRKKEYEDKDVKFVSRPVILDTHFSGTTEMENEDLARREVQQLLDLKDEDTLPVYEYRTYRVYPLSSQDHDEEEAIRFLATNATLDELYQAVESGLNTGTLSLRLGRIITRRLDEMLASVVHDHLSISRLEFDGFMEDFHGLKPYLIKNCGDGIMDEINRRTPALLRKWLNFASDFEADGELVEGLFLLHNRVNLQVNFTIENLGSFNIKTEPGLVPPSTHPTLHKIIKAMVERNKNDGELDVQLCLITSDGVYLEVIPSWFNDQFFMIKRLSEIN